MLGRIICLVIGYLLGSLIQAGYWLGKINKIDIRDYGSGNAGTTNVMRTLGKKAGILTYVFDMLKSLISALIIYFFVAPHFEGGAMLFVLYGGLGVVLGHNFPFYLKFKGGKGIAASSGVVISLCLFPKYCFLFTVLGVSTFALVAYLSKYVSLASIVGMTLFWVEFCIWGAIGWLPLEGMNLLEGILVVFILSGLAVLRHKSNIERLIAGNERKIGQKKNI
ncbi:MAG: glycerol-3-phosphate 1-O-acyltransferase PlsY [Lachnospira sp.]